MLDDPVKEGRVLGLISAGAAARLLTGAGSVSLTVESPSRREARLSDNVIGWLPGTDPRLNASPVVVTAHLDHIGDGIAPSVDSTDRIGNGALDNAIGVGAIIEVARRLAREPRRRARGILFVAFTAEEAGLLGSQWFVRQSSSMRLRSFANVNIDMPILTYPLADLLVGGTGWSALPCDSELERRTGLPIIQDLETAPSSDNLSFARAGVPNYVPVPGKPGEGAVASQIFMSEHYHRASDDLSQDINWVSADQYVNFVGLLTSCLANEHGP
jgi:Zn-dependent M28 family amino/carboxypeptidase